MASGLIGFIGSRWRVLLAAAIGAACAIWVHGLGDAAGSSMLIGWNVAAVIYLLPTYRVILFDGEAEVRARAGREDENRAVIMALVLLSVGVSLAAIVLALNEPHGQGPHSHRPLWLLGLSASTLVLSWLVVQSLFTLHYAHRYFGDRDKDGSADKGFEFNGEPPTTYRDFLYAAACIGATCQVSDFDVTTTRFRNLVTVHCLIAFAFNTMVLALGINIFGNVMGQ